MKHPVIFVVSVIAGFVMGWTIYLVGTANAWESSQILARKDGYAVLEDHWQGFIKIKNRTNRPRHLTCKLRVFDDDHDLLGQGWTDPKRIRAKKWRGANLVIHKRNIDQRFDHWRIRVCHCGGELMRKEIETIPDAIEAVKHVGRALDPGADPYDLFGTHRVWAGELRRSASRLDEKIVHLFSLAAHFRRCAASREQPDLAKDREFIELVTESKVFEETG